MPERRDSPGPSDRLSAFGQRLTGFVAPAPVDAGPGFVDFRYGDPRELPELRAALRGYLWRARGLRCEAEQIVVVNGSQQGLDLLRGFCSTPASGP